ncbi:MAG: CheC, inhibitor of methylation / FliN fusion protein [Thermoleophilia bacterium]|nr:CheC, inhibitor of methylation / FliN fusion protein [Thermoleophilia bacterium]
MSDSTVTDLLAAALQQAADVARARLGREVSVVPAEAPESSAILRFDLPITSGGRLSWYVANEDATGFSDILIGGTGDRTAVLTEMHLDALTVAFSDMLSRAVDGIAANLTQPLEAADIDLGMETELPALDPGSVRATLALEIAGFGTFPVVQQVDPQLAAFLAQHANADIVAAPVAPAPAVDHDTPAPAGPVPVAGGAAPTAAAGNVIPLATQPVRAARAPGDLEMLMNVPLPLTVELGRTQRTVRELVDFTVGSIIELGKLAGEPLDIMVNDRVLARGEVVVIDEEFGIRVTEILSPEDRLRGLG